MLPLFNSLLAQIIVLALLCVLLAAPFLALWVALSIRRDLGRIADAVEHSPSAGPWPAESWHEYRELKARAEQSRIANSAFGR